MSHIVYRVETELESDGRWIAEIVDVPVSWHTGRLKRKR